MINKFCDTPNYKKASSIEDAIKSNDCGTMVYYISNKYLSNAEKEQLIKSDNKTYYDIYYEVKRENIHESMYELDLNLSYTYMQYLGENDYDKALIDALAKIYDVDKDADIIKIIKANIRI